MLALLFVILVTILLVQGTRRIPVQYAKRVVGNKQYGGVRQFIPLKVNAAGVMPIIFAQAIMFIPMTLAGFGDSGATSWIVTTFSNPNGFAYNLTFFLMIIAFTYFYTAVTINPNQMAEEMKRSGGFIPGIKPGSETSEKLDSILSRITFPGSLFLAGLSILPAIIVQFGVQQSWAMFYGGTSLIIMVGVAIDTIQQINSYLLNSHYDGLMKTGTSRKSLK
jgi:preprotein translocase subunit SecY